MRTRLTLAADRELPDHLIADTESALQHLGWLGVRREEVHAPPLHGLHLHGFVPPVTMAHPGHDHGQLLLDLRQGWAALGVACAVVREPLATAPPALLVLSAAVASLPGAGRLANGVRAAGGAVVLAAGAQSHALALAELSRLRPSVALGAVARDLPLLLAADLGVACAPPGAEPDPELAAAAGAALPFPRLDAAAILAGVPLGASTG